MSPNTTETVEPAPTTGNGRQSSATRTWSSLPLLSVGHLALVPLQFSGGFLQYALAFFVLAVVAALVGFRGIAGVSMEIARIFVLVFLVLAVVSLVL